jgi:hypothetical protein
MRLLIICSFALFFSKAFSQIQKKRLPQSINTPTSSQVFPSLSADGNTMVYSTNYTMSGGFEARITEKTGPEAWAEAKPLRGVNRPGLDQIGSFCLSHDGKLMVFASRRSPSIGKYDIFISEKVNGQWSQPVNPGKPLNSTGFESDPSLSPDGRALYFIRCESMDQLSKTNCAIYVSHRLSAKRWGTPEKLPENINTGHETAPRMMADHQTLFFASSRSGGKGFLDVYQSRFENGQWTPPVALEFINTGKSDEYVSIPARGDIIYYSTKYKDNYQIFKAIIPEEFRPKNVLMIDGTVGCSNSEGLCGRVLVQVNESNSGSLLGRVGLQGQNNRFTFLLPEGAQYNLTAFPQNSGLTYHEQIVNLEAMTSSRKEQLDLQLSTLQPGTAIPLHSIRFHRQGDSLLAQSEPGIRRILGLMKRNPGIKLQIAAFVDTVHIDSVASANADMLVVDTIYHYIAHQKQPKDSVNQALSDKSQAFGNLELADSLSLDSARAVYTDSLTDANSQDIQIAISPTDSLFSEGFQFLRSDSDTATYFLIRRTYTNDRTESMAQALMHQLLSLGVPESQLSARGYADNWTLNRGTENKGYWIEIHVLP